MAEHEATAGKIELRVVLYGRPAGQGTDCWAVIVAGNQVLGAVQGGEQRRSAVRAYANGEVAEVPDRVFRLDRRVPALDQRLVHGGNRGKRAAEQAERTAMAEMGVAREPDSGDGSGRPLVLAQARQELGEV